MLIEKEYISSKERPSAVALGFFDGMHVGHRAVIDAILQYKAKGLSCGVFSFEISHDSAPEAKKNIKFLQTPQQKYETAKAMGVEWIAAPDFSEIRHLTPKQFVKNILIEKFQAKVVSCGEDFHFGRNAKAGTKQLAQMLETYQARLVVVEHVLYKGAPVSSTRIRKVLSDADLESVEAMLARPYSICLPIVHGRELGRQLGYPTANQMIENDYQVLKKGVYETRICIDGMDYKAITNVGVRPTFGGEVLVAESYIIGWRGELYGKTLNTQFIRFLRPEEKFETTEKLRAAIKSDILSIT